MCDVQEFQKLINQGVLDLETWESLEDQLENDELAKAFFAIVYQGVKVEDIDEDPQVLDDIFIYEDNLRDTAIQLFDDLYLHEIPGHLQGYIDYEAFARDLDLSGEYIEFRFNGVTYTAQAN